MIWIIPFVISFCLCYVVMTIIDIIFFVDPFDGVKQNIVFALVSGSVIEIIFVYAYFSIDKPIESVIMYI